MKIVVAGGTGFIGERLVHRVVEAGHSLVVLTRKKQGNTSVLPGGVSYQQWDGRSAGPWAAEVDGADAVVNLVGESLGAGRWTEARKKRIIESRVEGTRAIVNAIRHAKRQPALLINASAVGYYGPVEDGDVTESHPRGIGFLAETCEMWEQQARAAESPGLRVALLRTGVVLDRGSAALAKMVPPFKMFIGGPLGSGRQWFPWIHREDVAGAILHILSNPALTGPVNLTAPDTVTMKEFCSALGKALGRPSWAPVPSLALNILLGEMAEMVLTGQKAVPKKLEDSGYPFQYPGLKGALKSIFS